MKYFFLENIYSAPWDIPGGSLEDATILTKSDPTAINAIYDEKEGFSMKGNIDLDRGTYKITVQDIFTKEFTINKGGTLLFNGDPTEVGLNIRAKHLVPSASLSDLTTETSKR